MESQAVYLVPHDFTHVADTAIEHALKLAEADSGRIILLHVVKTEKDRDEAMNRLNELIANFPNPNSTTMSAKVMAGSIFTDITKTAEEEGVKLIVMGTHGARGLQKVFGSYAIKVITSSNIPFIIVQDKPPTNRIQRIAMPVNLSKESLQITRFVAELAEKYQAEIRMLAQPQTDPWLQKKIKSNIMVVHKIFAQSNVSSTVSILPGKKSLQREVIDFSNANNCDLIALAYFSDSLLPQFDQFAQSLITNEPEYPVLIVNAQHMSKLVAMR